MQSGRGAEAAWGNGWDESLEVRGGEREPMWGGHRGWVRGIGGGQGVKGAGAVATHIRGVFGSKSAGPS